MHFYAFRASEYFFKRFIDQSVQHVIFQLALIMPSAADIIVEMYKTERAYSTTLSC